MVAIYYKNIYYIPGVNSFDIPIDTNHFCLKKLRNLMKSPLERQEKEQSTSLPLVTEFDCTLEMN